MKTKYFYYLLVVIFVWGCEIDNYAKPHLTLSGEIVNAKTGSLVPSSGENAGTFLKVFEGNATQPLLFNTKPDGTFKNTRLFAANYRIVAVGPFKNTGDTIRVNINSDTKLKIEVIPYATLNTSSISIASNTAKVKVSYKKVNKNKKLMELGIIWSTYPHPNISVIPGGDIILNDVSSSGLVEGNREYTIENLESNIKYYIRAFALVENSGSYYNYSKQIIIKTK